MTGQFGSEVVDTVKEDEICIPSAKSLSPSGAFVDGMEDALF